MKLTELNSELFNASYRGDTMIKNYERIDLNQELDSCKNCGCEIEYGHNHSEDNTLCKECFDKL